MDAIDLFFPRQVKCMFCKRETRVYGICDECYKSLPFITGISCHRCGGRMIGKGNVCVECKNRHSALDRNYAVLEYEDVIKGKVNSFKQGGVRYLGETFAYLIQEKYEEIADNIDVIIPVPISDSRRKSRGYNQSEILCNELMDTGKVNVNILTRPEDTPHQTGLGRKNRLENLKDAFKVKDKKSIKRKVVLLVDDIYTTGSTLNECARTLKDAGASKVIGLVLARAKPKIERILGEEKHKLEDKITSLAVGGYDVI